jgi:hypothetical protein
MDMIANAQPAFLLREENVKMSTNARMIPQIFATHRLHVRTLWAHTLAPAIKAMLATDRPVPMWTSAQTAPTIVRKTPNAQIRLGHFRANVPPDSRETEGPSVRISTNAERRTILRCCEKKIIAIETPTATIRPDHMTASVRTASPAMASSVYEN